MLGLRHGLFSNNLLAFRAFSRYRYESDDLAHAGRDSKLNSTRSIYLNNNFNQTRYLSKVTLRERIQVKLLSYRLGAKKLTNNLYEAFDLIYSGIIKNERKLTWLEKKVVIETAWDLVKLTPFVIMSVAPGGIFPLAFTIKFLPSWLPVTFHGKKVQVSTNSETTEEELLILEEKLDNKLHMAMESFVSAKLEQQQKQQGNLLHKNIFKHYYHQSDGDERNLRFSKLENLKEYVNRNVSSHPEREEIGKYHQLAYSQFSELDILNMLTVQEMRDLTNHFHLETNSLSVASEKGDRFGIRSFWRWFWSKKIKSAFVEEKTSVRKSDLHTLFALRNVLLRHVNKMSSEDTLLAQEDLHSLPTSKLALVCYNRGLCSNLVFEAASSSPTSSTSPETSGSTAASTTLSTSLEISTSTSAKAPTSTSPSSQSPSSSSPLNSSTPSLPPSPSQIASPPPTISVSSSSQSSLPLTSIPNLCYSESVNEQALREQMVMELNSWLFHSKERAVPSVLLGTLALHYDYALV